MPNLCNVWLATSRSPSRYRPIPAARVLQGVCSRAGSGVCLAALWAAIDKQCKCCLRLASFL